MNTEPNRNERMVGEIIGLRLLVAHLLAEEAARSGDANTYEAAVKTSTLEALKAWSIGSDTPEGAERIRACAESMLTEFPKPMGRPIFPDAAT
jgi:hypothetical protein